METFPAKASGSADSGTIGGCPPGLIQMPAFVPAGIVLYRVTDTLPSIPRQWNIQRRYETAAKTARAVGLVRNRYRLIAYDGPGVGET